MTTENVAAQPETAPADEAGIIAGLSAALEGTPPEVEKRKPAQAEPDAPEEEAPVEDVEDPEGDNPDGESDEQEGEPEPPAIEAPASWSKADKELFAQLPPEQQAIVARRESERDKGVRDATAKAAEERKAAEVERNAAAQERAHYAKQLSQLIPSLAAQVNDEFANIDWLTLARTDQAEYVTKRAEYDAKIATLTAAQREAQRIDEARRGEFEAGKSKMLAEQREKLLEALPDLKDETKGPKLTKQLVEYAKSNGFTDDQIENIIDHKAWVVLNKARRFDAAQKARTASTVPPKAPDVVKPGAATNGKAERETAERNALKSQLANARSTEDQSAILAKLMKH